MDDNTAPVDEAAAADGTADDITLGDPGKKALEAERRARRAAEREKGDLLGELKTFREREQGRADDVAARDTRIADLEAQLLRERIGRRLSLSDGLIDRLRGTTEDEIKADAEALKADAAAMAALAGPPVADLKQGARTPPPADFNGNDWLRKAAGLS